MSNPIIRLVSFLVLQYLVSAADLNTLDGASYKNITVTEVTRYTLKFTHDAGRGVVDISRLADEDLAHFTKLEDREKDGRFWYERYRAIYRRWELSEKPTAESLQDAMKPVQLHREVIAEYMKVLAEQPAIAAAKEKAQQAGDDKAYHEAVRQTQRNAGLDPDKIARMGGALMLQSTTSDQLNAAVLGSYIRKHGAISLAELMSFSRESRAAILLLR